MKKKIALLVSIAMLVAAPAFARPAEMTSDRPDNSFAFKWNAEAGEMENAVSSTVVTRGDKVTFYAYTDERSGAREGKRLLGRMTLRLSSKTAVEYDGAWTYSVVDTTGETVFEKTKARRIVLRPKKGKRAARLRFIFDLPSGDYTLSASFTKK